MGGCDTFAGMSPLLCVGDVALAVWGDAGGVHSGPATQHTMSMNNVLCLHFIGEFCVTIFMTFSSF